MERVEGGGEFPSAKKMCDNPAFHFSPTLPMFPKSKTPARKKSGGAAQQTPLDRELRRFCEDVRGRIESVRANAFFNLARRLFARNRTLLNFIQGVSIGGTEKRVIINKTVSGFADFAHERLIMEFKRDLSSGPALTQAKKQLWTYFRGLHDEDRQNLFGVGEKSELWRLVATDGVVWRVFGVNYHSFAEAGKLVEKADDGLVQLAEFSAESRSAAEFRDFLRDSVFSDPERRLSAANIHRDFGVSSPLYRDARAAMQQALPLLSGDEATVAHNEWREYFSRVYGADGEEANLEKFYLHTYLATFAKILGWHVLNRRRERMDVKRMNKTVMRGVIDGSAFRKLHVENFADRDFFAWTLDKRRFGDIYPVFKRIANTVANYVFASPGHDLLQGVYQDIVDADTRHSLGEYYTPDWLCERIVRRLNPDADARILDPACGSGSFLRAAAAAKIRSPRANAGHIAERTVGMDIHPVAVQLAKTNLLMALNPLMRGRGAGKKITLRVYLANTLLREERDQIVRDQSRIRIKLRDFDKRGNQGRRSNGRAPESVVVTVRDKSRWYYNDAVALCDELSHHRILIPTGEFARRFAARLGADLSDKNTAQVMSEYREVYRRMRAAKTTGQNSIWAYVLKNLAQPLVLRGEFDHVIGNPPWLTYKDVATAEYQGDISAIADHYRLKPGAANMTHLELATLFASHCAESFLKKDGNLSFVMSASILDQGNHEPIRQGRARGFSVREIWDLSEVAPLFNIKSMVLFANREPETRTDLAEKYGGGFPGQRVTAKLPMRDVSLKEFEDHARARKVQWRLQPLSLKKGGAPRTTMFTDLAIAGNGVSASHYKFTQGATMFPRSFCFVESMEDLTHQDIAECGVPVRVRTADRDAKQSQWSRIKLKGEANPDRLYLTALGEHLFPFHMALPRLALVHLPLRLAKRGEADICVGKPEDGASADWFAQCEKHWRRHRTELNAEKNISHADYLNWLSKMTRQHWKTRHLVIYNASGKHICAAVLDRARVPLPFVAESDTYYYSSDSADECRFLAAVLNAPLSTRRISASVKIHIHTRICALPVPMFRPKDKLHRAIVELCARCEAKAAEFAEDSGLNAATRPGGRAHGNLRAKFRAHLGDELSLLDKLVRRLFNGE